jgi:hypothetical protein
MQHLTLEERERLAYISGDLQTAWDCAAILDAEGQIELLEGQIELLEGQLETAEADSLGEWERKHGPANDYREFFNDCFQRLADHYPCPEVTSYDDRAVIFGAIDRGEGTAE